MSTRHKEDSARVSATEAAKNFGRIVDRVRETGATYVVERGGTPAVRIAPVERGPFTMADFRELVGQLPPADADYLDAVGQASAARRKPRVRRNPWGR